MALREILIYPHPGLREVAQPVTEFNESIHEIVRDMADTMYHAPGIGLASIQVGIKKSVIVIDVSETKDNLNVLINPQIVDRKGEQIIEEGCLSFPGYFANVTRSQWIRYRAFDADGKSYEKEADGLLAVCVQHEIDHLNGTLFTDYLSRLKKHRVTKKFEKAAKDLSKERLMNA